MANARKDSTIRSVAQGIIEDLDLPPLTDPRGPPLKFGAQVTVRRTQTSVILRLSFSMISKGICSWLRRAPMKSSADSCDETLIVGTGSVWPRWLGASWTTRWHAGAPDCDAPGAAALTAPHSLVRRNSVPHGRGAEHEHTAIDVVEDVAGGAEKIPEIVGVIAAQGENFLPGPLVKHKLQGVRAVLAGFASNPAELVVAEMADLDAVVGDGLSDSRHGSLLLASGGHCGFHSGDQISCERFSNTSTVFPRCSSIWAKRHPFSQRSLRVVVRALTLRPRLLTSTR